MKRYKHNLGHAELLTAKMGLVYPVGCTEVLPGDTFQHHASVFCRLSPLNTPVMHRVRMRLHHFFVPFRLIWSDWEDFITGGDYGSTPPVMPTLASYVHDVGSLADYLGFAPSSSARTLCALPFRAYNMVWNEYFRDQDLQNEAAVSKASGTDSTTPVGLKRACWNKDYFTSARPWPQKSADITIDAAGSATVALKSGIPKPQPFAVDKGSGNHVNGALADIGGGLAIGGVADIAIDPNGSLVVPGTGLEISVADLRRGFALQRYAEARAMYGSRFTEYLAYLGIRSSDARLQRPEYLGGGSQVVQFSEVLQTAPESGEGVGNMRGHGIGLMRGNRYRKFFEEHGYVLTLMSVVPEALYTQSMPRKFLRTTREDFYQKELEHIGQQEIYKQEVYADSADPTGVFGYNDRYSEYRSEASRVHGEFQTTLDTWHLARVFSSQPVLSYSFVECEPTDRVFQDNTGDDVLWCRVQHSLAARRMISNTLSHKVM